VVRFASWHYPSVMKEKHSKTPTSLKTPQPQDDELA
ncbi:protein PsiE, partial [Acinetobacter baumannii]|nr:protein PsiE [Acinetobacter baumannii]